MTYEQAREWEMFTLENPLPVDKIMIQLAMIACMFADGHLQRKDKKSWDIDDFIPKFGKVKKAVKNVKNQLMGMLGTAGDEKAKRWAKNQVKMVDKSSMVKGTDGKMYKYALEEFATNTKPPRSLRNKKE